MKTIKIENIGGIDIIWQLCLNPQCIIITELCLPLLFMQQKLIKIVTKNNLDKEVDVIAKSLSKLAPGTMQIGLEAYAKQDNKSFDEALPYLQDQIARCFESDDAKEGISAFLEKRKPNWD